MKATLLVFAILCFSTQVCAFRKAAEDFRSFLMALVSIPQATNFENFVQGLLNTIGDHKSLEDMKKCITSGDAILEKIKNGLETTRPMDKAAIKSGLAIAFQGMNDFATMVKPCLTGYDKLQKLFSLIANADLEKLATKALGRIGSFFHLVMDTLEGFTKADYMMAGTGFGNLNIFLFGSLLDEELETEALPTAKTMEDFVKGVILGIEGTDNLGGLKACIKEDETIIANIIKGLDATRPMTDVAITAGLKIIFSAMNDLLNMLTPCMAGFEKLKKLAGYIAAADFKKILNKIHGAMGQFFHIIYNALEGFTKGNYKIAGKGIGDLMKWCFYSSLDEFAEQILSLFQY